jgi:hypothetical protein
MFKVWNHFYQEFKTNLQQINLNLKFLAIKSLEMNETIMIQHLIQLIYRKLFLEINI